MKLKRQLNVGRSFCHFMSKLVNHIIVNQRRIDRDTSMLLTLIFVHSVLLRGRSFDDFLTMSIHPEYEFMACSNKLEVLCSVSDYESVENHLEVVPSVQKLAVGNTMRLAGNIGFRPSFNCRGPLVKLSGSF